MTARIQNKKSTINWILDSRFWESSDFLDFLKSGLQNRREAETNGANAAIGGEKLRVNVLPDQIHPSNNSCSWNNSLVVVWRRKHNLMERSYVVIYRGREGDGDREKWRARAHTIAGPGGFTYKTIEALHGDLFIIIVAPVAVSRATTAQRRRRHGWPLPFWYFVRNKQLGQCHAYVNLGQNRTVLSSLNQTR